MQIYGPFRVQPSQPDRGIARAAPSQPTTPSRSTSPIDQLDLSPDAQAVGRMSGAEAVSGSDGDIRAERVAAIRRAIADGTYETPEKLDIALNRLLDEMG